MPQTYVPFEDHDFKQPFYCNSWWMAHDCVHHTQIWHVELNKDMTPSPPFQDALGRKNTNGVVFCCLFSPRFSQQSQGSYCFPHPVDLPGLGRFQRPGHLWDPVETHGIQALPRLPISLWESGPLVLWSHHLRPLDAENRMVRGRHGFDPENGQLKIYPYILTEGTTRMTPSPSICKLL